MAELIDVVNAMFKDRKKWITITDDDKVKFFFIITRYMSKKYPDKSQLLNNKLINSVSAMDTWFIFASSIPYPKWFWSKSASSKIKPDISDDEIFHLANEYNMKKEDVEMLLRLYPEVVKDEVKYYRDAQKPSK